MSQPRVARAVALAVMIVALVGSAGSAGAATASPREDTAGRSARCPAVSTDPADFPRAVPLPQDDYTVRGYLRASCRQLLDLALDTDELGPVQQHLVDRFRARGFHSVTSRSRTVEVQTGPETDPELHEEYVVRARGRGLRVTVDMSFVGAAPRWGGTALVRYVVRPLR
ncbi:hypothetical protein [Nocardioides zeicaulis]|uniref:Uncharacterized protein n=1 Tax=Nocardioides zeicaulis TaxID=1776857 RepID=A0ABV6E0S6_9ACTN